jgi:hypothetical protein
MVGAGVAMRRDADGRLLDALHPKGHAGGVAVADQPPCPAVPVLIGVPSGSSSSMPCVPVCAWSMR